MVPRIPPLIAQLQQLAQGYRGFHTPGHQRGRGAPTSLREWWGEVVFTADLAELPGLDNLGQPAGVLREAQARVAQIFGAEHTWFLVNGATAGVLASLIAVHRENGYIILPRYVHQSVIHGLILTGAKPIFITPEWDAQQQVWGGIDPKKLTAVLASQNHSSINALVLNSPTYKGVCGAVAECIAIAHQYNIPVIVDEAHGAHFPFHPQLPDSALTLGADVVIHSTHKVLTSLTQSALLHQQGNRIAPERMSQCLCLVQSSSPSYLLLASLVATAEQMAEQGKTLFDHLFMQLTWFMPAIDQIPGCNRLKINPNRVGFTAQDPTRLVIQTTDLGITGFALDELLHKEHHITAEFPDYGDLTFILSPSHTAADLQSVIAALQAISADCPRQPLAPLPPLPPLTAGVLSPREAFFAPQRVLPWHAAVGQISAVTVSPYPPGIPVLLPGEWITSEVVDYLQEMNRMGGQIVGCDGETIAVVSNW